MILKLTHRDRRALIGGCAIIVTVIAITRGRPAWQRWERGKQMQAEVAAADLARAEYRVRVQRPIADSLRARGKQFVALAPALLSGKTMFSAGATLAAIISSAAPATVHIDATQLLPVTDSASRAAFRRIAVRVDATGDVTGVLRMLIHLERGPVLLAIRSLSITQPEPAAPSNRAETLHVTLTVEGLMLVATSKEEP